MFFVISYFYFFSFEGVFLVFLELELVCVAVIRYFIVRCIYCLFFRKLFEKKWMKREVRVIVFYRRNFSWFF